MRFNGYEKIQAWVLGVAVAVGALVATPSGAAAQTTDPMFSQVEATPKGTIGLGLVGAEIGFIVPAVAGLDDLWAFLVFPAIGGAGGAVAGWFLIDDKDREELAVGALAFGMAMIVPTFVITLSATAYDPEDEADFVPPAEKPDEQMARLRAPPSSAVWDRVVRARRLARAGTGMVRLSEEGLILTAPGLSIEGAVVSDFPVAERTGTSVHLSLFSGAF